MIEVKVSYDRDPEVAEKACDWWAALALTPEEKEGVEDPVEMERLADNALDRAHTRFIVSADPQEVADKIQPYIDLGFTELVFHFPGNDQRRYIDEFAADVVPAAAAHDAVRDPRRALQRAASSRPPGSSSSTRAAAGPRARRTSPRTARSCGRTSRTTACCATTRRPANVGVFRAPAGYTNGHTVDAPGPAGELRARQPARHAHRARRHDHRARRPLRGQAAQQPQRRRRALRRRRSTSPTRPTASRATTRATRASSEFGALLRLPDRSR